MAISKRTVWIIGAQMDLGSFRKGVDMGPLAIRHAGLVQKIKDIGYTVIDRGDIVPLVATYEGNPRLRYEKEINDAILGSIEKSIGVSVQMLFQSF